MLAQHLNDLALEKSRLKFNLLVGGCVIVLSFFVGLAIGLQRKVHQAHAARIDALPFLAADFNEVGAREHLGIVSGVKLMPVGNDVTLNGKSAEMLSFVSNRSVSSLVNNQVKKWQSRGLLAFGSTSKVRGVALAMDQASGERFTFTAWAIPPQLRAAVGNGFSVQGVVASISGSSAVSSDGLVPGVPMMQGGHAGAVVTSNDRGGLSYTGVYTNPGSVEQNLSFYDVALSADGWLRTENFSPVASAGNRQFLSFVRGEQELTLLFSSIDKSDTKDTAVTVILGPKFISK